MATRQAFRYVSRRFSSNGKILREEEKAAENVYNKTLEKENLEKAARKGQQEAESASSGGEAKGSRISKFMNRKYAGIAAGVATGVGGLVWYDRSEKQKDLLLQIRGLFEYGRKNKSEDLHD